MGETENRWGTFELRAGRFLTSKIFSEIVPFPPPGFPRIRRKRHSRSSGAANVNVDMKPRWRLEPKAVRVTVVANRCMMKLWRDSRTLSSMYSASEKCRWMDEKSVCNDVISQAAAEQFYFVGDNSAEGKVDKAMRTVVSVTRHVAAWHPCSLLCNRLSGLHEEVFSL